jgi:hypothetical protein
VRVKARVEIDSNIDIEWLYHVEVVHRFFGTTRFKGPEMLLSCTCELTSALSDKPLELRLLRKFATLGLLSPPRD